MTRSFVRTTAVCALALLAGSAHADDARRRKQDAEALERNLPKVDAEPGRDRAPVRPPPWCDVVKADDQTSMGGLGRTIQSAQKYGWTGLLKAASTTCAYPNEPVVAKAVAVIHQIWINYTGLSDAQALETFKLRLQEDRLKADKQKLCDAIEVPGETEGEDKAFAIARRQVFGCVQKGWADKHAMWMEKSERVADDLLAFIDLSSQEPDELVRLAQVLTRASWIHGEKGSYFDQSLARYIVDQFDFKALSPAKLVKQLETAPYKGNTYARAVVLESIGRARMGIVAIEAEVAKKSADADWKELLVTAPQRGADAWHKTAETWKDALAKSNAFERTFYGPSRKAAAGCLATLLPDFLAIAKTLKNGSEIAFKESLSTNPIANLLYLRMAVCARLDGNPDWATKVWSIVSSLRAARGPRLAAYYAAFDALAKIVADRAKFPISQKDLAFISKSNHLYQAALNVALKTSGAGLGNDGKGIVKSVKQTPKGVAVTFVPDKHKEMSYDCKSTGQIIMFTSDGTPLYYQDCKPAGMVTIDNTAKPIVVPKEWATGIAAGAAVEFQAEYKDAPDRLAIPRAVYTDKNRNKLVNFLGMSITR